jgi:hypothetical protein
LDQLSPTALAAYGERLGLKLDPSAPTESLLSAVRGRQRMLLAMNRDAMIEVVVWGNRPVHASASKEELAAEIARIVKMDFKGLSEGGIDILAGLRGIDLSGAMSLDEKLYELSAAEGFWRKLRRRRRSIAASVLGNLVDSDEPGRDSYRFLPEEPNAQVNPSLKQRIQDEGIVGGITGSIRGAADNYIADKLNEIDHRIDYKLDQIDHRLSEWRDREISNRLRIVKITLAATLAAALLSLSYEASKRWTGFGAPNQEVSTPVER